MALYFVCVYVTIFSFFKYFVCFCFSRLFDFESWCSLKVKFGRLHIVILDDNLFIGLKLWVLFHLVTLYFHFFFIISFILTDSYDASNVSKLTSLRPLSLDTLSANRDNKIFFSLYLCVILLLPSVEYRRHTCLFSCLLHFAHLLASSIQSLSVNKRHTVPMDLCPR